MDEDTIADELARVEREIVAGDLRLAFLRRSLAEANARMDTGAIDRATMRLITSTELLRLMMARRRRLLAKLP